MQMQNIHHSDVSVCQFHVQSQAALHISDYSTFQIGHKLHYTRPISLAVPAACVTLLIFAPKHSNYNYNHYNYNKLTIYTGLDSEMVTLQMLNVCLSVP